MVECKGSFRNTTISGPIAGIELNLGILDNFVKGLAEASSKLVRITNSATGHFCYGRTHDFSAGISAGTFTAFDVPPAMTPGPGWALVENPCDTGPSTLAVVTNGISSKAIVVTIK